MHVGLRVTGRCLIAAMVGASGPVSAGAPRPPAGGVVARDTSAKLICGDMSGVRFELRFTTPRQRAYTANRFRVALGSGRHEETVSGEYLLLTDTPYALPNCGVFVTPTSGSLPMTIEVVDGTGSTASLLHPQAQIHIDLPLKPSWIWAVRLDIRPGSERKDLPRFGPPEQYARSVALPEGDSLFVSVFGYDPVTSANVVY